MTPPLMFRSIRNSRQTDMTEGWVETKSLHVVSVKENRARMSPIVNRITFTKAMVKVMLVYSRLTHNMHVK